MARNGRLPHAAEADRGPNSLQPSIDLEGKEATMHDFLSLCGSGCASSTVAVTKTGPQFSVATQDLLQPLQKSIKPVTSNAMLPQCGFVLNSNNHQSVSTGEYSVGGQQSTYSTLVNGTLEPSSNSHSKCNRPSSISYPSKGQIPQGIPMNNKHWQPPPPPPPPQQGGLEVFDSNRRQARVISEEDDEDDDDSPDQGYNQRKEIRYQKGDLTTQQLEGRTLDNKGITPRSKHSATEQRRRSKINDRFQMLRQLLPNADQKRDKASFLLEVIEYIQMLHEKVKKYEAGEHGGQERTTTMTWDKSSGQRDPVANTPAYRSFPSSVGYDAKEVSDSNGYSKSQSSPLRAARENGITSSELISNVAHVSAIQAGMTGCLSNYDNKSLGNKHALLTFAQPPALSAVERSSTPVYQTTPQILPEGRTLFGHLIRQEEQAATMKSNGSLFNKVEAVAIPQLQQMNNHPMTAQTSNYLVDQDHEKSRTNSNNKKPDEQHDERRRPSDLYQTDATKDNGKGEDRFASGVCEKNDIRALQQISNGAREECRVEASGANEQQTPAFFGGVINIKSAYSQGILDTLTRTLQNAGVDLGQASISVQIDLGKPSDTVRAKANKSKTVSNVSGSPSPNKEAQSSQDLESEHPKKRPKIELDP